jgi:tetratricopeptide (TPR) repeat protein
LGLAYLLSDTKRPDEAERQYRQALPLFEKAVADSPSNDSYRSDLGHTMWQLADLLSTAKRPAEAEPALRKALAVFEKLVADFPDNKFWMFEQGFSHWKIGDLMKDLGRLPDAAESYRQALAIYTKLSAEVPNNAEYRWRLLASHCLLIEVLLPQGRHAEAAKQAIELPRVNPGNLDEYQHAAGYLDNCAALAQKDESLSPPERKSVADGYAKQAEELRREARERNNPDTRPKPANEAGTKPQETPSPEAKKG